MAGHGSEYGYHSLEYQVLPSGWKGYVLIWHKTGNHFDFKLNKVGE